MTGMPWPRTASFTAAVTAAALVGLAAKGSPNSLCTLGQEMLTSMKLGRAASDRGGDSAKLGRIARENTGDQRYAELFEHGPGNAEQMHFVLRAGIGKADGVDESTAPVETGRIDVTCRAGWGHSSWPLPSHSRRARRVRRRLAVVPQIPLASTKGECSG